MDTTPIGPFLGVNTRRPDFSLKTETGAYLRSAINVDINNAGDIIRRRGITKLQSMTNAHSLKMLTDSTGVLVRGSVMYAITLPAYTEIFITALVSDAIMSYTQVGGDLFYSNGTDIGRVHGGVRYPIGLPPPPVPTLSQVGGSLFKGRYQVGIAYVNSATGEEGALSDLAYIELASTGGIRVSLPGSTSGADNINVYLSESNGTVQMLHSIAGSSASSVDLTTPGTGRAASLRSEDVLPPGTLFYSNGRLCSFKDNMVYVGIPFRLGYYLPLVGFIPFHENVTVAIANESGTYIATDKTYFIPGDLLGDTEKILDVLPCGAVPGTAFTVPHKKTVGWFSKRGIVLADTDGTVDTSMSENIDITPPVLGISNVTETGGFRRVYSCGYSMNLDSKAVTLYEDWAFTSLSRRFGTRMDGIYQIDTDGVVNSTVNFGKQNFGTEKMKFMPAVYLGSSSGAVLNLRVKTPSMDYTYAARGFSLNLQMQRVDPGLGLLSNWFDLELSNTAGCDFTLASMSFAAKETARRI